MKRIRRLSNRTPGLAEYLEIEGENASWDRFRSHAGGLAYREIIEELTSLQHGLCGYCETGLVELDRQVEHVVQRSDAQHGALRALDVTNLIACCRGGENPLFALDILADRDRYMKPLNRNQSCGQRKGSAAHADCVDPRDLPALPSLMRVLEDGAIEADPEACTSAGVPANRVTRTIEVLNLNAERLRLARERRWTALNDEWGDFLDDPELMHEAAKSELLPEDGRLRKFFTTSRCYFGLVAEEVLGEQLDAWI